MEDLILQMELRSRHPFVRTLKKLRNTFGEQWPPRASFEDWPENWTPYRKMADEMSYKMRDLEGPEQFREWIDRMGEKGSILH